jgi:hypothetical protein
MPPDDTAVDAIAVATRRIRRRETQLGEARTMTTTPEKKSSETRLLNALGSLLRVLARPARVDVLRQDGRGGWLPGGSTTLTRVPCVGELIFFRDSDDDATRWDDAGPYRVTRVKHYPMAKVGCDAEVWLERVEE